MDETHHNQDMPYPAGPTISYPLSTLLERIEHKLDSAISLYDSRLRELEKVPRPIPNGEIRVANLEALMASASTRIDVLEKERDQRDGGHLLTRRVYAALGAAAATSGAISGIIIGVMSGQT